MSEDPKLVNAADPLADVVGAVDVKLEEEGEWFRHAPLNATEAGHSEIDMFQSRLMDSDGNGLRGVKVHSRYSAACKADERTAIMRAARFKEKQRQAFLEEAENERIAKHCVSEWDFTNRSGEQIPISTELVKRIMTEEQFRFHRAFVVVALQKHEGLIERAMEDDSGN